MNIGAAGEPDMEDTCTGRQGKKIHFSQKETLPLCVFPLGLTNKVIMGQ